jgi:hypothetical protein
MTPTELMELVARERVASFRRDAERYRLVREISIRSPQQAGCIPGPGARVRGRRLTGGEAVWLGRAWTWLSRASAGPDWRA